MRLAYKIGNRMKKEMPCAFGEATRQKIIAARLNGTANFNPVSSLK